MAHPNSLKNLKRFVPGVSGNSGGRPAVPEELRAINSLSQTEVTKLISKYARMTLAEVELCLLEKKIPVLELSFCSIFVQSIKQGDFTRIAFLLDRCIGKIKDFVEDDEEKKEREALGKFTLGQLLELVKENLPQTPEAS